jgi:protein-L-isoaspartate O-methyltransferase
VSLKDELTVFLAELWADVEEPSEIKIEGLHDAYNLMAQVDGKPPLEYVAGMYDNISGDEENAVYSHSNRTMYPRIIDTGAWICHNLDDGQHVLELGSNTGHHMLWWASKHPHSEFAGLEISEKSVEVAEQWLQKKPVDNVRYLTGNLIKQHPELVGEKFDVIINCFTLETIPDLQQSNWKIPEWILDSLTPNAKIIACLTVPDYNRLATIIDAWNEQGFNLTSLDLFPLITRAAHPYFIMEKQAKSIEIDVADFIQEKESILYNSPWMVHNPHFDNPMAWGEYDDENLEDIMIHPLRLETWTSDAPEFSTIFPSSDSNKPVFEFSHSAWVLDDKKITLILDWVRLDMIEQPPSARICFKDCKKMGGGLELWKGITDEISDRLPDPNAAPLGYCREYILALNNHFSE